MPLEYTPHGVFSVPHKEMPKPPKITHTVAWPDGTHSNVWKEKTAQRTWWHIARPGDLATVVSHFSLIRAIAASGRLERVQ